MVLAQLLTAAVLLTLAALVTRRAVIRRGPAELAESAKTAPGAPVAAGAPGAAPRRRPANNAAGHFTPYTRTSGKNAPISGRALSRRRLGS